MPVHSMLGRAEPRIRSHLQANRASLLEKEFIRSETVYTTLQILESWIHMAQQMLKHVTELVKAQKFKKAASDCYLIERIWKLLFETEFLLEFGFLLFLCLVDKKDQLLGLCLVDKKEQENPRKFGCVILIFKSRFVFVVFLLKMSSDLNLCIEF